MKSLGTYLCPACEKKQPLGEIHHCKPTRRWLALKKAALRYNKKCAAARLLWEDCKVTKGTQGGHEWGDWMDPQVRRPLGTR